MTKTNINKLLYLSILAELLIVLFSYFRSEFILAETVRLSARYSGRLSLLFIVATFLLVSLNWSVRRTSFRNYFIGLTLIFSLLHLIHLVLLGVNIYLNDIDLIPYKLAGGALAYLLLLIYPWELKYKNPPKWMDNVYFYYLILIMVITILSRLNGRFKGSEPSIFHYIGLVGIFITLIFHITKISKKS